MKNEFIPDFRNFLLIPKGAKLNHVPVEMAGSQDRARSLLAATSVASLLRHAEAQSQDRARSLLEIIRMSLKFLACLGVS